MLDKKPKPFFVAYVGTTKIAFLKARLSADGKPEIVSLAARLAHGFERGVVKDLTQASRTLSGTIRDVMGDEVQGILPCRVVVSNSYLKNYTFQSSVYFQDRPHALTLRDVREAIAQTRSVATIPLEEVIVQAIPQSFLVNDLDGIQNPLGLEAGRIGVTLRLLTLDFLVHSNLLKVFERCDIEVQEVIPCVLTASQSVLSAEEKQEGVILVVAGGDVTHFACYKDSILVETVSIPIGADHITRVIAEKLNVDYLDAQRVKECFGSAFPKMEFQEELIPISDSNGHKKYHISRADFELQMRSGLDAFFDAIRTQVRSLQARFSPLNRLVLTGGGIRLDGFRDVVQESISPIVRIGMIHGVNGPEALIQNPAFSGILGALSYTHQITDCERTLPSPRNWLSRTVETARNWIFEYF